MDEDATPTLRGGCECGAVRYEAHGRPYHRTVCHCTTCRRTSGAPMVGWFSVGATGFRFTQGEPRRFRSSAQAVRSFCGDCGTPLLFKRDGLDEVDVSICSLDDPEAVRPEDHTYVRSRLGWAIVADGLPQYLAARED